MSDSLRAADHLANERTFLAWTRTSLSLMGIGFVVARFGVTITQYFAVQGHPLAGHTNSIQFGAALMLAGVVMEISATYRYHHTRRRLLSNTFEPASRAITVVAGLTALIGLALALDMLLFHSKF